MFELPEGDEAIVQMTRPWKLNLQGKRFGMLTVLSEEIQRTKNGAVRWRCRCDCGTETIVITGNLRSGRSKSCGCRVSEIIRSEKTKHGMCYSGEYNSWSGMRERCYNENSAQYHNYGGRGIKVCGRWLDDFQAFYEDMGPRPTDKHSIDRIDVNGDYEPGNCRWAIQYVQTINRRRSVKNSSGLRGVFWNKKAKKWVSQIGVEGKRIYVGAHEDFFEIACMRLSAENKLWNLSDE